MYDYENWQTHNCSKEMFEAVLKEVTSQQRLSPLDVVCIGGGALNSRVFDCCFGTIKRKLKRKSGERSSCVLVALMELI